MKIFLTLAFVLLSTFSRAETIKELVFSSLNDTTGKEYQIKTWSEQVENGWKFKMKAVNIDDEFVLDLTPEEYEQMKTRKTIRVDYGRKTDIVKSQESAILILGLIGFIFISLIAFGLIVSPSFRKTFFDGIIWLG